MIYLEYTGKFVMPLVSFIFNFDAIFNLERVELKIADIVPGLLQKQTILFSS